MTERERQIEIHRSYARYLRGVIRDCRNVDDLRLARAQLAETLATIKGLVGAGCAA